MSAKVVAILGLEFQDNATAKLQEASNNFKKTTEETSRNIQLNYKNIAFGATSAAVGIVSLATSTDQLSKASLTAEKAQLSYEKAQKRVNDLLKDGKGGTEEYRLATETARLAQEKAKQAQDAYSDKVLNFSVGLVPQFISAGIGIQKTLEGITFHGTSLATMLSTKMVSAFQTFRAASITAFITNPVGIAIIAVTTLIGLLVFNVDGLRDAFVNLGKAIFQFLNEHFKPLADLLSLVNVHVIQPLAKVLGIDTPQAADKAGEGFDNTARSANNLSRSLDPGLTTAANNVKNAFTVGLVPINRWSEQSKNLQDITFGTVLTMRNQIQTIQLTASEVKKLNEEYEKSIEKNDKLSDALKRAAEWKENLNRHFEEARANAFGAAQGNIDASRFKSDQFARLMQDQITASGGLTSQEFSSALLLSGVSAGQEGAAIWSSQAFLNAVAEIQRGKAFNAARDKLGDLGIGIPQEFRDTFLPNRSPGVKVTGSDFMAIPTQQRTDQQLFENAVITLANKIGQGVTEDQIKMIVREVVTQVLNGMEGR